MGDNIPKDLRQLRACLSCSLIKVILGKQTIKWQPSVKTIVPLFPVFRAVRRGRLRQLRALPQLEAQPGQRVRLHQLKL